VRRRARADDSLLFASSLDPWVGRGGFDFIADIGALAPMRTIGLLLGVPEQDQPAIRASIDARLELTERAPKDAATFERAVASHLAGTSALRHARRRAPRE
jgi:cytochrome P450